MKPEKQTAALFHRNLGEVHRRLAEAEGTWQALISRQGEAVGEPERAVPALLALMRQKLTPLSVSTWRSG